MPFSIFPWREKDKSAYSPRIKNATAVSPFAVPAATKTVSARHKQQKYDSGYGSSTATSEASALSLSLCLSWEHVKISPSHVAGNCRHRHQHRHNRPHSSSKSGHDAGKHIGNSTPVRNAGASIKSTTMAVPAIGGAPSSPSVIPSPSSTARFMAVISRILPKKKSSKTGHFHQPHLHQHHHCSPQERYTASTVSTVSIVGCHDSPCASMGFQQQLPCPLTARQGGAALSEYPGAKSGLSFCTPSSSPVSLSSVSNRNVGPVPPCLYHSALTSPVAVAEPACFPGAGPLELATKHQKLLELQQCSRRPNTSSSVATIVTARRPVPQTTAATTMCLTSSPAPQSRGGNGNGGSRHLIPHHHHGSNASISVIGVPGNIPVHHDSTACSGNAVNIAAACSPLLKSSSSTPSFLQFRRSSVESLSTFFSMTSPSVSPAVCPPSPQSPLATRKSETNDDTAYSIAWTTVAPLSPPSSPYSSESSAKATKTLAMTAVEPTSINPMEGRMRRASCR